MEVGYYKSSHKLSTLNLPCGICLHETTRNSKFISVYQEMIISLELHTNTQQYMYTNTIIDIKHLLL